MRAVVLGALGLQVLGGPLAEGAATVEAAAFQALVPGLDEELLSSAGSRYSSWTGR